MFREDDRGGLRGGADGVAPAWGLYAALYGLLIL